MSGTAWKKFACCRPARVAALALALAAGLGLAGCRTYRAPVAPDFSQEMADRAAAIDLVRAGQRLEYAGKEALAEDKYRPAVNLYRETPSAWNNLGRLLMKRGANEEARVAFLLAAELSPRDPMPLYNLGAPWDTMGYLDDAGRWYEEALSPMRTSSPRCDGRSWSTRCSAAATKSPRAASSAPSCRRPTPGGSNACSASASAWPRNCAPAAAGAAKTTTSSDRPMSALPACRPSAPTPDPSPSPCPAEAAPAPLGPYAWA